MFQANYKRELQKTFFVRHTISTVDMTALKIEKALIIFVFCVFVPCLDQYTDLSMVIRLLNGPEPHYQISSGKSFIQLLIVIIQQFQISFAHYYANLFVCSAKAQTLTIVFIKLFHPCINPYIHPSPKKLWKS